jgi:adenine-specific DNA-methyltransferase
VANYLDSLLDKIDDPAIATALRAEIEKLKDTKQFGLVFERHLPETVRLYSHPVRKGLNVQKKAESADAPVWRVLSSSRDTVVITRMDGESLVEETMSKRDVVVIRQFNEPIYPGLKSLDKVERGGDKPSHVVINAENYHALELLLYAYEGQVDALYLDPPYNTGSSDWRYNNNYVDQNDEYRHSKWLSFIEKRLHLAKRLLNPEDSVLIVTIDEKEVHRLALLLNDVFPDARTQMVSAVINPSGAARSNALARVDEYIFLVMIGDASPASVSIDMLNPGVDDGSPHDQPVTWHSLRRRGASWERIHSPGCFYPVFLDASSGKFHSLGEPLPSGVDRSSVTPPEGTFAVWPLTPAGAEGRWQLGRDRFLSQLKEGTLRITKADPAAGKCSISYLTSGTVAAIASGEVAVTGRDVHGGVVAHFQEGRKQNAKTVWNLKAHDASAHGTFLLREMLPDRKFPYPKSLYAVEDSLRLFVKDKPEALIIDFFGGSGTTAHAVARLNRQDGGRRRSIVITNNEVSAAEAKELRAAGYQPGDEEWESRGIARFITWNRVKTAITGLTPEGDPIKGSYSFVDEFPMSEGFEENAEFFDLVYLDRDHVSLGRAFGAIDAILWLAAGARGPRIGQRPKDKGWAAPEGGAYGVLFDIEEWREFTDEVNNRPDLTHVFVVTESEAAFQQVVSELPAWIHATQLYDDYLSSFEINTGARAGEAA